MNFIREQRAGEWRAGTNFRCKYCETLYQSKGRPKCAFDGEHGYFVMDHFGCGTIVRLKTALRMLGRRSLKVEEREGKGTSWHYECPDGVVISMTWFKSFNKGYAVVALEDYGPLSVDRAYAVVDAAARHHEGIALGVTDEELENIRTAIGQDGVDWGDTS